VLAVAGEHRGVDDAEPAQDVGDDGQLEYHAHEQRERGERGDVAVERDGAVDALRHAVRAEEAERDGEEQEIAHQHADHEEEIDGEDGPHGVAPLVVVEGGRDEAEQLVEDVGRRHEQADVDGRGEVGHELARQVGGNLFLLLKNISGKVWR